jgi:hypothetical protein
VSALTLEPLKEAKAGNVCIFCGEWTALNASGNLIHDVCGFNPQGGTFVKGITSVKGAEPYRDAFGRQRPALK